MHFTSSALSRHVSKHRTEVILSSSGCRRRVLCSEHFWGMKRTAPISFTQHIIARSYLQRTARALLQSVFYRKEAMTAKTCTLLYRIVQACIWLRPISCSTLYSGARLGSHTQSFGARLGSHAVRVRAQHSKLDAYARRSRPCAKDARKWDVLPTQLPHGSARTARLSRNSSNRMPPEVSIMLADPAYLDVFERDVMVHIMLMPWCLI